MKDTDAEKEADANVDDEKDKANVINYDTDI